MILDEDGDTGMFCVVIVDDGNGGSGLASPITVDFEFIANGMAPVASKLLLYPWYHIFYSA